MVQAEIVENVELKKKASGEMEGVSKVRASFKVEGVVVA
jgi:hypothetical protein